MLNHLTGPQSTRPAVLKSFMGIGIRPLQSRNGSSSSATVEAFLNVVDEAMACGVPCVVTRVGDLADIVADTGISVPTESPKQLADGCEQILTLPEEDRKELGRRARERVEQLYSLEAIADEYLNGYQAVSSLA